MKKLILEDGYKDIFVYGFERRDSLKIVEACKQNGIIISIHDAKALWEEFSNESSANWLSSIDMTNNDYNAIFDIVKPYFDKIGTLIDYDKNLYKQCKNGCGDLEDDRVLAITSSMSGIDIRLNYCPICGYVDEISVKQ